MALSFRNIRALKTTTCLPRSTRPMVVAKANMPDEIAAGFVHIFTPAHIGNKEEWEGTETPFTGKIKHHGEAGSRRPFKDGWTSKPQKMVARKPAAAASALPTESVKTESNNVVSFLNKAAERVVAHNFTGDGNEPAHWNNGSETSAGWAGKIHTRSRDGFHVSKK